MSATSERESRKALLIEDNAGDARLVGEALRDSDDRSWQLDWCDSLASGMERLEVGDVDVIVLDLGLPETQGLDTLRTILSHSPGIPIVILTGLNDESVALEGLRRGAQDYLIKGKSDGASLLRALYYAMERKQHEAEFVRLALYDPLTGLPNLRLFTDRFDLALAQARRSGDPLVLLSIDIDDFKSLNDQHGHIFGDAVLNTVGRRLAGGVREVDVVARVGGDEFLVLLPGTSPEGGTIVLERLDASVHLTMEILGKSLLVRLSIGLSSYPTDGDCLNSLRESADNRMYEAKFSHKSQALERRRAAGVQDQR